MSAIARPGSNPPDVSCIWVAGKLRIETASEDKAGVLATLVCAIAELNPEFGALVNGLAVIAGHRGVHVVAEPQS